MQVYKCTSLDNKFNLSRRNLWKFKDVIKKFRIESQKTINFKHKSSPAPESRKEKVVTRVENKSPPYGAVELNEISLRAYTSPFIRGFCERWKINQDVLEDINDNAIDVLEKLKQEFPRLQKWDNKKLMTFLCENWKNADDLQISHNKKVLEFKNQQEFDQNQKEFLEQEEKNPANDIKIEDTTTNQELLDDLLNDNTETLNWGKAMDLVRYSEDSPSIILDNMVEVNSPEIAACPLEIDIRDSPSNRLSVLTSYLDLETGKWHESKRASHPFLAVEITKINPKRRNECEEFTASLQLMADSGAMCSLLNYESVRAMGLEPDMLEKSNVSITGVNGKKLEAQTRQMCSHSKYQNWNRIPGESICTPGN